ncbi:cation:proton antiporter [Cellulomonas carbonis]|uniref:Cation transporter n=1 Tax=Cellulomonas carbonis T26 TaxID=947969 RepID=A0A0A0BXH1_9CELL|nr:cation:proton antiporter [Cellulomonas carbonis]KGM12387.1 cation transporter [Cellulomonas carbonis T26]GGC03879.1 cation transporter [Cellulomonas carbonis]
MIEIEPVALGYAAIGVATLLAALLPKLLRKAPVSMPMLFVAAGMVAFALIPELPTPDPVEYNHVALRLTEICVIVSLMGAGLAINRPFDRRRWASTWRLLGITMPLTILAVGVLGWAALGLGVASAVLLAAALGPTDPVLATEVQVSEPVDEPGADDDETRFALTSEAGLNDGLAFPFTWAAVAISLSGVAPGGWLGHWLAVDVVWRIAVGVGVGWLVGALLGRLFFSGVAERMRLADHAQGFVALAATFLTYGLAEIAHGYGFVAVFVSACALRASERGAEYHHVLHSFVEQVERLLTVAVLVLVGGAVSRGALDGIGLVEVLVVAAILLVVRPVAGWLGLAGGGTGPRERGVIAFFGVRGVGSFFYVAFALEEGSFPDAERLWAVITLVVLGSVLLHGVTATPAMRWLDGHRRAAAQDPSSDGDPARTTV